MSCNNENCSISSGLFGEITFGSGVLDNNGYWEFPCEYHAHKYLNAHISENPDVWPKREFEWTLTGQTIYILERKNNSTHNKYWFHINTSNSVTKNELTKLLNELVLILNREVL